MVSEFFRRQLYQYLLNFIALFSASFVEYLLHFKKTHWNLHKSFMINIL